MNEEEQKDRSDGYAGDGTAMQTRQNELPKYLDPATTMELVQKYVESERNRTRRVLLWTSSLFLFSSLLILGIFLWTGIYMLRNSNKASNNANLALEQATEYGLQMVDISNKVNNIDQITKDIGVVVQKEDATIKKRNTALASDLENFRKWVESTDSKGLTAISTIESRLADIQKKVAERDKELAEVKKGYAIAFTGMQSVVSSPPVTPVAVFAPVAPVIAARGEAPQRVDNTRRTSVDEQAEPPLTAGSTAGSAVADLFPMETIPEPVAPDRPRRISEVVFPDGDRYKGEFKEGLFNGWGLYKSRSGDQYEGEFSGNMKQGRGTFLSETGDKYAGDFKNDMKEGKGMLNFVNGDKYVGEFSADMMNGKGTLIYQDGSKYSGDMRNNLKDGNGVFSFANGDIYKGQFKNGIREGNGTYSFGDGSKYIGEFRNGLRDGNGRYIFPEGEEYIGEFKEGKKDGRGICVYANGLRVNVVWKDDKLISETPLGETSK
jgi:hypothetical protein